MLGFCSSAIEASRLRGTVSTLLVLYRLQYGNNTPSGKFESGDRHRARKDA
jgi:hypothetical protein